MESIQKLLNRKTLESVRSNAQEQGYIFESLRASYETRMNNAFENGLEEAGNQAERLMGEFANMRDALGMIADSCDAILKELE